MQSLNVELSKNSEAIRKTTREIDLLREYRTRLIADVVTGKLDVCGVELPTIEDELELGEEELDLDEAETDELEDPGEEGDGAD